MSWKDKIDANNIPRHIAIIMDGNGRWAKKQGALRVFGHNSALTAVREASESAAELGVEVLTLYAFSTENWNRPKLEVMALMELLVSTIKSELPTLQKNNISLKAIGNISDLPSKCQNELREAIEVTKNNTKMKLVLALSYSGRWDITQATQQISKKILEGKLFPSQITEEIINEHLSTKDFPDPELMIRTSGEQRISNFLLWQLAYSELYITEVLWPDFRKNHLYEAIESYQARERRFGKTSEQLAPQ
ncbi:MAG: isoprenyl transferase [Cytophagales bacterium]|nr:MAG: isoprenyl transferase [Cytophagales bacterium]